MTIPNTHHDYRTDSGKHAVEAIACPWEWCDAEQGERCKDGNGHHMNRVHAVRVYEASK